MKFITFYKRFLRRDYAFFVLQTSPRKLVGQRSEGEGQRTLSESQAFVADFSHFSPKNELPENTIPSIENTVPQSQQFTGVCGAFHIYRKPSPSKKLSHLISQQYSAFSLYLDFF